MSLSVAFSEIVPTRQTQGSDMSFFIIYVIVKYADSQLQPTYPFETLAVLKRFPFLAFVLKMLLPA